MSSVGQKSLLTDIQMNRGYLEGIFRGVVENNAYDGPEEKAGQCRVRIFGVHSSNKSEQTDDDGIPTDELPWARQVTGLTGNATSSVPQIGAYVFCFFENGNIMQPRYFGIAPGTERGNKKILEPQATMVNPTGEAAPTPETVQPQDGEFTAYLNRVASDDTGTKGTFTVKNQEGMVVFSGMTLELPWRNNLGGKSCFPKGTYQCIFTASPSKAALTKTYEIRGTPGRAGCRIHKWNWGGNKDLGYRADIEGCVLLGSNVVDNADNGRGKRQRKCEGSEGKVRDLALTLKERKFTLIVSGVVG